MLLQVRAWKGTWHELGCSSHLHALRVRGNLSECHNYPWALTETAALTTCRNTCERRRSVQRHTDTLAADKTRHSPALPLSLSSFFCSVSVGISPSAALRPAYRSHRHAHTHTGELMMAVWKHTGGLTEESDDTIREAETMQKYHNSGVSPFFLSCVKETLL